ncbi:MAG: hypothetical protein JNK46_01955 [Methylobacteriaceae bacterium]|nr:hypothetical protein [Methylobacteriaceae bacterium]
MTLSIPIPRRRLAPRRTSLAALLLIAAPAAAQQGAPPRIDRAPTHSTIPAEAESPKSRLARCAHLWRAKKRAGEDSDLIWRQFWAQCSTAP